MRANEGEGLRYISKRLLKRKKIEEKQSWKLVVGVFFWVLNKIFGTGLWKLNDLNRFVGGLGLYI